MFFKNSVSLHTVLHFKFDKRVVHPKLGKDFPKIGQQEIFTVPFMARVTSLGDVQNQKNRFAEI